MKQLSVFFFLLFLSVSVFSQTQKPPPPCGYNPVYMCDYNNDGFVTYNLNEALPFSTFCLSPGEDSNNYADITYYIRDIDMNNKVNPIANIESYTISSLEEIYYSTDAINNEANYSSMTGYGTIEINNDLLATGLYIKVYDGDSDGLSVFDLTSVNLFCDSSIASNYNISFHTSQLDATNNTNEIANPSSFLNSTNSQTVYVRAEHITTGDVETTSVELTVLFAVANSIPDVYACSSFDLSTLNATVLGDQSSYGFTVSYYVSQSDAENKTNSLADIFDTIVDTIIFCKVEENTKGSYAITPFNFFISKTSLISQLDDYEICDDDGDGVATFDLASIRNKIIQDYNYNYFDISFHLDSSDTNESFIPNQNDYINIENPQTIYIDIEDWGGEFDCFVILPINLVVQDCSTKGVIEINAFYDEDENATFENDEINFLNGVLTYEKNNDGILRNLHSSNGVFNIISDDENDTYDISYNIFDEYNGCYSVTTTSYEDISVTTGNTVNYNFPITKNFDCGDIAVYLVSYVSPRPGFDYYNRLIIVNKGLETVTSGTIEFVHDPIVTLNNVYNVDSGNTVTNTATGFTLDFANLEPNQYESVIIDMNVPIPTSLGTLLTNTAAYSVTDLSAENNTSTLSEIVIGSYDPNDIAESHGPEILHASFSTDNYLYYTVRFQNVGTADAINVSIDNTLDSDLDESTIQMLNSSHTNVFTRTGSQLNWQFDNIHLPSEDMDEPNSHGYVFYKIKPKAGYSIGDIIPNTAEIYFDFNPAVITNTFNTEFTTTLSNTEFEGAEFSVFPNPTQGLVKLKFQKSINDSIDLTIYDFLGKEILKESRSLKSNSTSLNLNYLSKGIYFIKVGIDDLKVIKKVVIN